MNGQSTQTRISWILVAVVAVFGIGLSICAAVAGFAIGRASATPETVTQVVTESQDVEVTRVVPVTIISEVQVTSVPSEPSVPTATGAPAAPTAVPTVESAPEKETVAAGHLDLSILNEVWDLVETNFDGETPSDEEILEAAIEGSLESLGDQFTRYIPAEVAALLNEDSTGSVSGVGAVVTENEEGLAEVIAPIEGQPADLAGLRPGDVIIAVDDESMIGVDYYEVVDRVRGPEGTTVKLTIRREEEAEPMEFSIVRARFDVPVVETSILGDENTNVAYLRLTEFNHVATEEISVALESLLTNDPAGLILDLRDNPGGFLSQSIMVADLFLPQGDIVFRRNIRGLDEGYRAEDGDIGEGFPMVVLVNARSASASEIVAGAIQANERGILIGEPTWGKGSVQTIFSLSDGSELRVTSGRWYTPDNRSISEAGITPDIVVVQDVAVELGGDDDLQLERAIEYLTTGN